MSRPYPFLPIWSGCRSLPLLACAALSLRAASPGQSPAPVRSGAAEPAPAQAPAANVPASSPAAVNRTEEHGFLGVFLTELRPEVRAQTTLKDGEGLMISLVAMDSPAARAGVTPYDILLRFNDQWVISEKQVATLVENAGPGCEVELTLLRQGRERRAKVSLCRFPQGEERAKIRSLPQPPPPEEMLTSLVHTFQENPSALESVWRMFHGPFGAAPDGGLHEPLTQRFALWDEGGQVELILSGNSQTVRAWDDSGRLIFDGPCRTPQERAEMPADALVRLETLEKRRRNMLAPGNPASAKPGPVLMPRPVPAAPAQRAEPSSPPR